MWLQRNFDGGPTGVEASHSNGTRELGSLLLERNGLRILGTEEEAIAAVERSLDLESPPILLTPLRWFKQDKLDFYQKYVVPLMARYDLVG